MFAKVGEASVAVSSPDNHTVTYTCPEGDDITVAFAPQPGWQLHSVTLNGEPVHVGDNNTVTLSSISGENELNAIYIQDANTDIDEITADIFDAITIALSGHMLSVRNKPADAAVLVYDIAGNLVAYGLSDELYVPLSNEVAIIKVENKVFKVAVR